MTGTILCCSQQGARDTGPTDLVTPMDALLKLLQQEKSAKLAKQVFVALGNPKCFTPHSSTIETS